MEDIAGARRVHDFHVEGGRVEPFVGSHCVAAVSAFRLHDAPRAAPQGRLTRGPWVGAAGQRGREPGAANENVCRSHQSPHPVRHRPASGTGVQHHCLPGFVHPPRRFQCSVAVEPVQMQVLSRRQVVAIQFGHGERLRVQSLDSGEHALPRLLMHVNEDKLLLRRAATHQPAEVDAAATERPQLQLPTLIDAGCAHVADPRAQPRRRGARGTDRAATFQTERSEPAGVLPRGHVLQPHQHIERCQSEADDVHVTCPSAETPQTPRSSAQRWPPGYVAERTAPSPAGSQPRTASRHWCLHTQPASPAPSQTGTPAGTW